MDEKLISLIERYIGKGYLNVAGEYIAPCPFCKHYKPKLQIGIGEKQWYHCWVCHTKGRSTLSLFRKIKAPQYVLTELKNSLPEKEKYNHKEIVEDYNIVLPKEFIPLSQKSNSFSYSMVMNYLKTRNIFFNDVVKYNIGYCLKGEYKNMIIIPSYDRYNFLNYFTSHTFIRSAFKKFKNPKKGRNIIGFENTLSETEPIIIVESPMDAIILRRNATPLFGTIISESLLKYLIESPVNDIYICLDGDALKTASNMADELINIGKNVYQIELPIKQDPGDIGYEKMWKLINESEPTDSNKIFKNKIKAILRGFK